MDCDDADASVGQGSTWYADTDIDGFGDATVSQAACNQPAGFVSDNTDCDDTNASSTSVTNDADCDGYVTASDCDDGDAAVYPGAPEVDGDGVDSDCDGSDNAQSFSGQIEMPSSGTIDGYSNGSAPWSAINGPGGRAATRVILTQNCANPQLALYQHPTADSSIQGAYFITDASGSVLAQSTYETYQGCNNCWLPHNQRLSTTLAANTFYYVGYMNQGGDMSGPSIYEDSSTRTVGIATFDSPLSDLVASVGIPGGAVSWQNRWRIDCQ